MTSGRPIDVLMVEDDEGDVVLTQEALKLGKVDVKLEVVNNGTKALDFLRRRGPYASASRPDLVLLDLNLPGLSGREVLAEIKNDPELRRIPVVILTSSQSQEDILQSYDLHANCYVAKPVGLDAFVKIVKSLDEFWFTVVRLPPK